MTQGQAMGAIVLCIGAIWFVIQDWRRWQANKEVNPGELRAALISTLLALTGVIGFLYAGGVFG